MRNMGVMLLTAAALLLTACAAQQAGPPGGVAFLDDIEGPKQPSLADIRADQALIEQFRERKALLARVAKEDQAERRELEAKQSVVDEKRDALSSMARELLERAMNRKLDDVFSDQLAGKLLANSNLTEADIRALLSRLAKGEISEAEFRSIIEQNTSLTAGEVSALLASIAQVAKETKELEELVANATSAEELERVLRERSGLTDAEIAQIVQQKKEVLAEESNLKKDALERIVARLRRNKELGIDLAFCAQTASIDQFFVSPVFFGFDQHNMDDDTLGKFTYDLSLAREPFRTYDDIVVQVEGNADERGAAPYNKALGDRRWYGPSRVMLTQSFNDSDIRGVSRGEECPLERLSNETDEDFWKKNRRDDFVVKLKE